MSVNKAFELREDIRVSESIWIPVSLCDERASTSASPIQFAIGNASPDTAIEENHEYTDDNTRNTSPYFVSSLQDNMKTPGHGCSGPLNDHSIETRYSYLVLAVCFATFFLSDGVLLLYGIIYQDLKSSFDTDTSTLALPSSVQTAMSCFGALITSPLLKVLSLRVAGIIGGLLAAAGLLWTSFVNSLAIFTVTYGLVTGFGYSFLVLLASIGVPKYFDRHRAVATGISNAGSSVGVFAMGPLTRYLLDKYTWRGCMLIQAGIVLQCWWLSMLLRPDKEIEDKRLDDNLQEPRDQSNIQGNTQTENNLLAALKTAVDFSLLKELSFVLYMLALFTTQLAYPLVYVFAPDKGTEMGFTKYETGWFVSCIGIGSLLGRILVGFIGDAPFLQGRHIRLHRFCLILAGVNHILIPSLRSLWSMYTVLVVCGFAGGGHIVMLQVVIVELFGQERVARSFCIWFFVFGVAYLTAAPLSGFIRDNLNSYDPAFYLAGGQFFLSFFITFLVRSSDGPSEKSSG